ncbi:MAG TPA: 3-hydroxyacyl-CoA dehydrogenase NAD-binding domain-containing protein [Bacteroidia bacterium]|nr:3-hydroxyacyl-CoA dehydrogenase NAD-binding domain-containing protein [Bacteroidia bacterium]
MVGVIGSGAMGSGIAQVAATVGHKVILYDNNGSALEKSKTIVDASLKKSVEKQKLTEEAAKDISQKLNYSEDISSFSKCGIVIEAIIENLEIKKEIFAQVEKIVSEDCILATNTSSLSIASISSACKESGRVLGIHFFNPAQLMPLVEIIPSLSTVESVLVASKKLIDSWGKITVVAKDTPGFIVNRVARPYYGEAIRIFEEGIADISTIDWAMKETGGFKMGPFELMDFIGNDVNYKVTETVWEQFFYDPRYKPSLTQKRLFESGRFGKKSGRGYYDYAEGSKIPEPVKDKATGEKIFLRIFSMLVNEAVDALYLNVAGKEDIDLAMTKGVNYPKGLLRWSDEMGLNKIYNQLKNLQEEYGEDRYRPSVLMKKMVSSGEKFFI